MYNPSPPPPPPPPSLPPSPLIPNLPDDISLQILARIPRSNYPTLSLISKSWHSTITSPTLYNTRKLLQTTQSSLYINIRINSTFNWYTQKSNSNFTLTPLPSIPNHPIGPSVTSLSPHIYVVGGSINDIPTNSFYIFDCRFRRWEIGPRLKASREFSAAEVVGDKVYVIGGCNLDSWTRERNWAEVYDVGRGVWESVGSGGVEVRGKWMHASAVVDGRVYAMADRGGVVLDVGTMEWGNVPKRLDLGWRGRGVVVGGVLYCYDYLGKIRGFDFGKDRWEVVRGVEKGFPKFMCGATMVELDGKLCVVWEGKESGKEVEVMCAVVEVRKDEDGGLSGRVLRVEVILVVPRGASISHCLAVRF